jgi:hypothetical protein
MKYFTPELYIRGNSEDADSQIHLERDWDKALERYERRWTSIKTNFPEKVQRFQESGPCLHDAELLQMFQEGEQFILELQPQHATTNIVILNFTLSQNPVIQTEALPKASRSLRAFWLYEEFDIDRRGQYSFEVLLSNGWVAGLKFSDFSFRIGQRVFPPSNGQAAPRARPKKSKSA